MSNRREWMVSRVREGAPVWVGTVATVLLFVFAVKLLGDAAGAAAPLLESVFGRTLSGDVGALGLGWVAAYLLTNGSVVAAVALSLFDAGVVAPTQLFLLVAGSRLGAAAVVVLVGALDYFQKREHTFSQSTSMGVLAFLLTHSVYLPATALGYVAMPYLAPEFGAIGGGFRFGFRPLAFLDPVTGAITGLAGPVPSFVLAVAVLFGSLRLFDRILARVETERLRDHVFRHLRRRSVSFLFGILITGATTSVAFSLGVVVPLYNRGFVKRDEMVPYVLGANIGTLVDTLVVAVVLESTVGVAVVGVLLAVSTVVTLVALLAYDPYWRAIDDVQDRLVENWRTTVAVLAALVAVPLGLLVISVL